MKRALRAGALAAGVAALAAFAWAAWLRFHVTTVRADVLVVGAGIGGLSAAYEAGFGGAEVAVAEMSSVFGGNAALSEGGLFIVDTPLQREQGVQDSAELAEMDMMAWGEDADPDWVRTYVRDSRREIWDWLTGMGIRFTALRQQPGEPAHTLLLEHARGRTEAAGRRHLRGHRHRHAHRRAHSFRGGRGRARHRRIPGK
jgi:succinate dehydrogenase/fumarate reductase flavoprotein subunit